MKYALSPAYCLRDIMGDCILVPVNGCEDGTNRFWSVNESGKVIIDCIGEGMDIPAVAEKFAEVFEIGAVEAEQDIREFIDGFVSAGIIVVSE